MGKILLDAAIWKPRGRAKDDPAILLRDVDDYFLRSSGGRFLQELQISNANPHMGLKNLAYFHGKFLDDLEQKRLFWLVVIPICIDP